MSELFPQTCPNLVATGTALTATGTGALIRFSRATGFLTLMIKASAYAGSGDFTMTLYGCDTITAAGLLSNDYVIKQVQVLSGSDTDMHIINLTMSDGLLPYMRLDAVLNGGTSMTLATCTGIWQLWG